MGQQVHVLRHDGIAGYREGGYFILLLNETLDEIQKEGLLRVSRYRGSACV
jgi:hypothetical protein